MALGNAGEELKETEKDATAKVSFMEEELGFYNSLSTTLDQIRGLAATLSSAQEATLDDQVLDAIGFLKKAEADLQDLKGYQQSALGGLLLGKVGELKKLLGASLRKHWYQVIHIDHSNSKITIREHVQGKL